MCIDHNKMQELCLGEVPQADAIDDLVYLVHAVLRNRKPFNMDVIVALHEILLSEQIEHTRTLVFGLGFLHASSAIHIAPAKLPLELVVDLLFCSQHISRHKKALDVVLERCVLAELRRCLLCRQRQASEPLEKRSRLSARDVVLWMETHKLMLAFGFPLLDALGDGLRGHAHFHENEQQRL